MAYGITSEQFWGLTPRQVGELVELKRQKEYELAYYTAMVTAQSTWGKAPKPPEIHKKQRETIEQTDEEMLLNWKSIKAKNR